MALGELLTGNLVLAFVTGIISSFGHCLGMCGGILAIYSARQSSAMASRAASQPSPGAGVIASREVAKQSPVKPSLLTRIVRFLPLHLGRITTYAFFGALIGLAGSLLDRAGGLMGWQGAFSILIGLAMIVVSLSLMGILPPIEMALAKVSGGGSPIGRMRGLFGRHSFLSTVSLGILWGFLPCGLVFAMLVLAARAQTPWGGALTMLAFGLGTIPTLVGFGLAANLIGPKLRGRLQILAGALILLFALQTILRGLAVAGVIPSMIIGPVMLW